jgi:chemotaxis signal transduction protein
VSSSDSGGKSKNERRVKYLTFCLGDSQYGVPLSEVKEVIGLPSMVPIPGGPAYFLGLINLRGRVITAIDLKKKLGFPNTSINSKRQAVIITDVGEISIGCVVDAIDSVMSIAESEVERDLSVSAAGNRNSVQGIARFEDRPMILLLDLKAAADVSEIIELRSKYQSNEGKASLRVINLRIHLSWEYVGSWQCSWDLQSS